MIKKTIKVKRSQIQEVYKDGVLVGYVEHKGNGEYRALVLNAHYDILIIEDE